MSKYLFEQPYLYKNKEISLQDEWLIFPNSIFSDMDSVDCNDTVSGVCYTDKSLDECIGICATSPDCTAGYYISNSNKNVCVPIKNVHKNMNMNYRLQSKNSHPILQRYQTFAFTNKKEKA